jgi:hypothetical protein
MITTTLKKIRQNADLTEQVLSLLAEVSDLENELLETRMGEDL